MLKSRFFRTLYTIETIGLFSLVISLESLFEDVGVKSYTEKYYLAMRGVDSSGEEGDIFYGTQSTFDRAFAVVRNRFSFHTGLGLSRPQQKVICLNTVIGTEFMQ